MTRHRIASVFAILVSASSCAFAQFDGGLMAGYGGAMATVGLTAMNTQMLLGTILMIVLVLVGPPPMP